MLRLFTTGEEMIKFLQIKNDGPAFSGSLWTEMALCAGIIVSDIILCRNAAAEEEQKSV